MGVDLTSQRAKAMQGTGTLGPKQPQAEQMSTGSGPTSVPFLLNPTLPHFSFVITNN